MIGGDLMTRSKRTIQRALAFPEHGGKRRGSGRKRLSKLPRVPHREREELKPRFPLHVTLRLADGLPTLRKKSTHYILRTALARGANHDGFRVVHYSTMGNHVHLVCEADDNERLSRGMQGLCVRLARALNRWWERRGTVFPDRFHVTILRSPTQVRNALAYVLKNAHHHKLVLPSELDPFSSAAWFDGWQEGSRAQTASNARNPLAVAITWLLNDGWKKLGLLPIASERCAPTGRSPGDRGSSALDRARRTTVLFGAHARARERRPRSTQRFEPVALYFVSHLEHTIAHRRTALDEARMKRRMHRGGGAAPFSPSQSPPPCPNPTRAKWNTTPGTRTAPVRRTRLSIARGTRSTRAIRRRRWPSSRVSIPTGPTAGFPKRSR
jgi:REP element-mobilizing transposase RayT